MTPKSIPFKKIEHSKFTIYYKKAQDFYQTMLRAHTEKNWHSVGLEAIHCAISATDALLVYLRGVRSTSKNHLDTVDLLVNQLKIVDTKNYAQNLIKILEMKNLVEYEDRLFTQNEATEILKRTERYFNWIKNQLPSS